MTCWRPVAFADDLFDRQVAHDRPEVPGQNLADQGLYVIRLVDEPVRRLGDRLVVVADLEHGHSLTDNAMPRLVAPGSLICASRRSRDSFAAICLNEFTTEP